MTNHWIDLRNSDVVLVMGSNAAENHPISFKWVTKAMEKGATLLSVDPRFTRTSSKADVYAPLRSGSDIAFLGGMINYIIQNNRYNEDYVRLYTNASFLVNPSFKLPGDNNGVYSGLKGQPWKGIGIVNGKYDKSTWSFQKKSDGTIDTDKSLKNKNCVFQLLKQHYSRYDIPKVSKITGTPENLLRKVYDIYSKTGAKGKAGTIMYAMGWTQHTVGTQNIRTMAIAQLLLGNIGVTGGGVNALRGESNVQGSTDHCLLFHIIPGYLKTPRAKDKDLATYNKNYTPKSADPMSANWWGNYAKYSASLMRAHYGTAESIDKQYTYFPKLENTQNASWLNLFDVMLKGGFEGLFAWGMNPACSGANAGKNRKAMAKLKWLVNVNIFDNETGSFWKGPGVTPSSIQTEVFQLPCAAFFEKSGSLTNSGRMAQWRYRAVHPPGDALPDSDIMNELYIKVRDLYKKEGGAYPDPVVKLAWDYGPKDYKGDVMEVDTAEVAKEINGYFLKDVEIKGTVYKKGTLVPSFAFLQADGSTSSGNWLYCQSWNESGNNMARRGKEDPSGVGLYPKFGWAWPVNRRIIYNRASVDEYGVPWDKEHPVIWWKGNGWGGDVPDGGWPPLKNADGSTNPASKYAYIMKSEGHAHLFGPGLAEGPFPEHYEPLECPTEKNLMSPQKINPIAKIFGKEGEGEGEDRFLMCDPKYPYIGSTYRVSEHWQTGLMTRHIPYLVEMQPGNFCEMSPELAAKEGIKNGEIVVVSSARGSIEAVAIVTKRFRPFNIDGQTVHQVGVPWHFGWATTKEGVYGKNHKFPTFGDSANLLTPNIGDANTMIPESKAFMVNVKRKGVA